MEDNGEFASGKFIGIDGRKKNNATWEMLTSLLISTEGPKRSSDKWRRVWSNIKTKEKSRASARRVAMFATGGGPAPLPLTEDDEGIVNMVTFESSYGLQFSDTPTESALICPEVEEFDQQAGLSSATGKSTSDYRARLAQDIRAAVDESLLEPQPGPSTAESIPWTSEPDVESCIMATPSSRGIPYREHIPSKRRKTMATTDALHYFQESEGKMEEKIDGFMEELKEMKEQSKKQTDLLEKIVQLLQKK